MRPPAGLVRLRALVEFDRHGVRHREGDVLMVESAEAKELCAWGRCELTAQAREQIFGRDPWFTGFRTR